MQVGSSLWGILAIDDGDQFESSNQILFLLGVAYGHFGTTETTFSSVKRSALKIRMNASVLISYGFSGVQPELTHLGSS